MKKTLHRMFPLFALVIVAGCLQTERNFTMNPDGSGKVTVESTMSGGEMMLGMEEPDKNKSRQAMLNKVAQIVGSSEGIDVWKDVVYRDLGEGKIYFKGTAYFPDFNTVRFQGISNLNFHLGIDAGGMKVTVVDESNDGGNQSADSAVMEDLSDAEVERRADSIQQEFKMSMSMLRLALDDLKETISFRLPGSVTTSDVFARTKGGNYQIVFSGKRLMEVMDSLAQQRELFVRMARYGGRPPMEDESAKLAVWGGRKPLIVASAGSKPLFNYAREVAAARKGYERLRRTLKLD